jgi:acetyl esterase/lipase
MLSPFLRRTLVAWSVCVASLAAAAPMTLADYMAMNGPEPTAQLAYGPAPSQRVELFLPVGAGPFPVAMLMHGGCWVKEFAGLPQLRPLAVALVAQGIAVWHVEYRRADEAGGGYPGTYEDASAALDLLRDQAKTQRLDLTRVVLIGHSAGGHLAQWLAGRGRLPEASPLFRRDPPRIREVIALGAISDLRAFTERKTGCGPDTPRLTGLPSATRPDVFADTDPAALLPSGAHTVLVNGELDRLLPPTTAAAFAERARQAGDQVETLVLPQASHFDEVSVSSPAWPLVQAAIRRALRMPALAPK